MATPHAIVGREAELRELRDVVDGPGPPCVVFVEGEAGVGKTALLEAVVAEAAAAGSLVLRARPTAAEAGSSFAALHDLLGPVIDGLPRLPAPQRRALAAALLLEDSVDPVDPRLVGLACLSLLEALPGAVVLVIDDWQWLDPATLAVLSFVVRRVEPGGAKVLATVRSGEADEALAALVRALPADQALELALAPLDAGDIGRLVHARTGERVSPPAVARLHHACAGNPLMALELVRASSSDAATDIRRLLARRLAALSPDARGALRFVAALGPDARGGRGGGRGAERARGGAGGGRDRPRRQPVALQSPADRRRGAGAHAARGVARDPRQARRAHGPTGAAGAPPRHRVPGPGRGRRGGAGVGSGPGLGARRDDRGSRAGRACRRAHPARRRAAPTPAPAGRGGRAVHGRGRTARAHPARGGAPPSGRRDTPGRGAAPARAPRDGRQRDGRGRGGARRRR